ncbi:polysaccharide pyruvyl transferase family protein [Rhizobium sp. RCC_161_2]|uniref:polysaccharide pyruvyl transferase family protein n=1 Tax=Rhizobium sp. RCC_161_2 TaxID=3239219 RepID=UPI003524D168
MFKSPVILGIFSQKNISNISLEQAFSNSGKNTGNLFFSESLYRNLEGASMGHLGFTQESIEDKDCIVLAAANWLDSTTDFSVLYERLKKTKKAVVIVGLGAQSSLNSEIPVLKEGTVNLLKLIAERSALISVRGEFSATVLERYGIQNIAVTGCPSLLLSGSAAPTLRPFNRERRDQIVIGATRHGFESADLLQLHLYRQALKFSLDQVLQSELADMYFSLGRLNNQDILARSSILVRALYGDSERRVTQYLSRKAHVFFDVSEWLQFMSTRSLYVGTRLHGAVASLLAGTPATLIVHDSRTLESARVLNIPYVRGDEIDLRKDIDFSRFYDAEKLEIFSNGYRAYRNKFRDFFKRNSLSC